MIRCFVTVAGPYVLLPYFLKYYSRIGVEQFIVNAYERDPERYRRILDVVREHCASWQKGFWERKKPLHCRDRTVRLGRMAEARKFLGDWALYPDMDEFAEFPGGSIREYTRSLPPRVQVIQGRWWDRLASDGTLPAIDPEKPLEAQFPIMARLSDKFFKSNSQVIVACKDRKAESHHPQWLIKAFGSRAFSELLNVHHFKWHSTMVEHLRGRRTPSPGSVRYLDEHDGQLPIHDKRLQCCQAPEKLLDV